MAAKCDTKLRVFFSVVILSEAKPQRAACCMAANLVRMRARPFATLRLTMMGLLLAAPVEAGDVPKVRVEPFVQNVEFPVHVTHDGTKRLFIVEQRGRIRLVVDGKLQAEPFLDIRDRVRFGGECGLLCVAFHPDFSKNGRFFVNYTSAKGGGLHTRISEFHVDPKATQAAADTERILLMFKQPWANHNGGQILFGPDGKLYIGTGDGGLAGDPLNSGQSLNTLLGKILRLDVNGDQPYGVPADNPFVGRSDARPEIWCYGMRNPWRFCFYPVTKLMYCADVGQDLWEEIDIIEKGKNYGWNIMEGNHEYKDGRPKTGLVPPIKEYDHNLGLSITGGFVYRGKKIPALAGYYIYGDYDSGRVWGLKYEAGRVTADVQLLIAASISSFGEDNEGEIYLCNHYGHAVLKLVGAR